MAAILSEMEPQKLNIVNKSIADMEKDLGRYLKELLGNKEAAVTHQLLEQLLSEIKHTRCIAHLGVNRLTTSFAEILLQQNIIAQKLEEHNNMAMGEILLELQRATRLLNELVNRIEGSGTSKRDRCTPNGSKNEVDDSTRQVVEDLRRFDPLHSIGSD